MRCVYVRGGNSPLRPGRLRVGRGARTGRGRRLPTSTPCPNVRSDPNPRRAVVVALPGARSARPREAGYARGKIGHTSSRPAVQQASPARDPQAFTAPSRYGSRSGTPVWEAVAAVVVGALLLTIPGLLPSPTSHGATIGRGAQSRTDPTLPATHP